MTIFDWYLLRRFIKIFLVCFMSLSGLYVVIHAFTNLDETLELAKHRSIRGVLVDFYAPRILDFFVQMAALIALISAIFSFTMLQKTHEVTALEAAGVGKRRIARPLILMSLILVATVAVCRESILPRYRNHLIQGAPDLLGDNLRPIRQFTDFDTLVAVRGGKIRLSDNAIVTPHFSLRELANADPISIQAEEAVFTTSPDGVPGYLVKRVSVPKNLPRRPNIFRNDALLVMYPSEATWLESDQCFIAMNVPPQRMLLTPEAAQYAPIRELIEANTKPGVNYSNRQRVEVHRRILQPFLELTLIALGFPMVIARGDRNVFFAAALSMFAVGSILVVSMVANGLGASRIISPPALAAWLPLLIFSPFAIAAMSKLDR